MSHGIDLEDLGLQSPQVDKPGGGSPLLVPLRAALDRLNGWIMVPCMAAVVVAAAILSYSVAARYFLKIPTEWQDETAVFLLIGATFFSGAFVQSKRGHVGVEAPAPEALELLVEEADVEGRVVDHDLRAGQVGHQLVDHLGELRLVGQELVREAVDAHRVLVVRTLGIQVEVLVGAGQPPV